MIVFLIRAWVLGLVLFSGLADASVGKRARTSPLRQLEESEIPEFQIDDAALGSAEAGSRDGLMTALKRQLPLCQDLPDAWDFGKFKVSRERWCKETISWFLGKLESGASLQQLFESARRELDWYESTGKPESGEVQFTGYFFPVHRARLVKDSDFRYPVYRTPPDLKTPYFTRKEIESEGALAGKNLEIAFLNNPVDPYILQVQGSGALLVPDGSGGETRMIVNYASENGRPYSSLGKAMRAAGIEDRYISLQGIHEYFTHVRPDLWTQFSNLNESYVFFKKDQEGPYGYSGVILTPKHSIAVDRRVFPMGMVGLIQTERPEWVGGASASELAWKKFVQFVVTQDTGGAIRTPGRVDVFWGEGPYAEIAAGKTDRTGRLLFFLPKKRAW